MMMASLKLQIDSDNIKDIVHALYETLKQIKRLDYCPNLYAVKDAVVSKVSDEDVNYDWSLSSSKE
jgi:hypothetical protein